MESWTFALIGLLVGGCALLAKPFTPSLRDIRRRFVDERREKGYGAAIATLGIDVGWSLVAPIVVPVTFVVGAVKAVRMIRRGLVVVAVMGVLVAAAPIGAWAAGYETRSGGSSTSVYDSVSGVPVPGGGTRSTSTSNNSYESWSRSQPIYNGWERVGMSLAVARDAAATMEFLSDSFRRIGGPSAASAPPAPVCYSYAGVCDVWTPQGWQRIPMPTTQPAPLPTVTVSVGQPVPASRQCTDGRGFYWLC